MNSVQLRNVDAQIAEEVYKERVAYRAEDDELVFYDNPKVVPFWSTNILCTWGLLKKLQGDGCIDKISLYWDCYKNEWLCTFRSNELLIETEANTAPLAICKAVLEIYARNLD